jgi:V/A-type H+/Na+-transporting ATPase subunit C
MATNVDYGYVNARIRGMKSRLLGPEILESLILKPDIDAIITELEKTPYREELEKAAVQHAGIACIEVALRMDIARTFRKIYSLFEEEKEEKYARILLNRWDVHNIKTILRGKNIHEPSSEILGCLIPAGELDEAILVELVKQPDVRGVIDLLATWRIAYSLPLTRHLKEFGEKRDLAVMEDALDKFYFENALESLHDETYDDRSIREMVATEIDVTNIRSVLKMVRDRISLEEAQELLIPGGSLKVERLMALMKAGTIKDALKQLMGTPYEFLGQIPEETFRQEKISVFEKDLERFLIRKGTDWFFGDPLSIAIAIGYVWAKFTEVTNIRIISRLKMADVAEKIIREELVHV